MRKLLALYVLTLAALLVGFDWVWDDRPLIVEAALEPALDALKTAWTSDFWALAPPGDRFDSGMYRPLVTTTYVLERALGVGPFGAHLLNLLLHCGVALGAVRLAERMGGQGLVAGALVLLHPHAAELVGNVAARTDLMAALFLVWSLALRGRAALPLMLAACLSKEVAFFGVVVHLAWTARERSTEGIWAAAGTAIALGLRLAVVSVPEGQLGADGGLLEGAASSGWALVDLLVPLDAGPWPATRALWPGWVALALAVASLRWTWRGVAWALLFWAPVAGWVPLDVRASRALLYVPALGLALWLSRRRVPAWPLLLLAFLQVPRMLHWRDPLSLWSWGTEKNAELPLAWLNLGRAHAERGELQQAEAAYRSCAALAVEQEDATFFVPAATSLGRLALEQGRPGQARVFLEDAVRVAGPGGAPDAQALLATLESSP